MGKKNEKEYSVITEVHPQWLDTEVSEEYVDTDLLKIIMFFVINSPCEGQSKRGIPLTEYGWKSKPWYSNSYLKDKLDKIIFGDGERLFYFANTKLELERKIKEKNFEDDFYLNTVNQRIAIVKISGKNCDSQYMSLFYHIRNSLAHGRLAMYPKNNKDIVFVMEDGEDLSKNEFGVTARIVISKNTLLKIIERLKAPPEEEVSYEEEIVLAINNGKNTKKKIMQELDIDEKTYKKTIDKLKMNEKIVFKEKYWDIIEK